MIDSVNEFKNSDSGMAAELPPIMKIIQSFLVRYSILVFPFVALLIFFPAIDRSFASDDFLVLKRVGIDRVILINGFFRPLSDITLSFNYWIGNFNPAGYYIFNILLHGFNSWVLFCFCMQIKWSSDKSLQERFALLAAIIFLTYPFHSESIVWILGRASIVANTFGLLSLLFVVRSGNETFRIILASVSYFIGLLAYESIFVVPAMALVLLYQRSTAWKVYIKWIMAFVVAAVVHFFVRTKLSGGVLGGYGQGFFELPVAMYAGNILRVMARLIIPPIQNLAFMAVCFIGLILGLLFIVNRFIKKHRGDNLVLLIAAKFFALIALTCVIPVFIGVSTKTSEGDRLLYFPSFFLCCLIALLVVAMLRVVTGIVISGCLVVFNLIFVSQNNRTWTKASAITRDVISMIKSNAKGNKIFLINLPDELDGAYIFRLGLQDALVINGIDTTKITVVNHLKREQMLALPNVISTASDSDSIFIPPVVRLSRKNNGLLVRPLVGEPTILKLNKGDAILYWNKEKLVRLSDKL